jgi:hypothetical protein
MILRMWQAAAATYAKQTVMAKSMHAGRAIQFSNMSRTLRCPVSPVMPFVSLGSYDYRSVLLEATSYPIPRESALA